MKGGAAARERASEMKVAEDSRDEGRLSFFAASRHSNLLTQSIESGLSQLSHTTQGVKKI